MNFSQKVVLITGSGSGIGRATAVEFARQGARVMLNGRNAEKLERTRAQLAAEGFEVAAFAADITDYQACVRLVEATEAAFGRLDVVIANASITMRGRFDQSAAEHFRAVMDSNFYGAAFPTRASLEALKKTRGSLVFIGSVAGVVGLPSASAYSAGKMALTGLAQSLRMELADAGVHVGIVYVGFTQNDPDKLVLDREGKLVPVAARNAWMQQTQAQVGRSIVRLVAGRRSKMVLSAMGKLTVFLARFAPWVVEAMVRRSMRKNPEMFE